MVSRAWLSEYAEQSIDIQYFIFSIDNVGLIACDYLVRAADRGVKVRILVDDIMVDADIEDILMLASHENIEIKIYNPGVNLGKNIFEKAAKFVTDFRSANQPKTFIVDGQIVITGGRNIVDEYFYYDHEYNFRDRDVLLIGKSTNSVSQSFGDCWESELSLPVQKLANDELADVSDPNRFDRLHEYACNPDNFSPDVRQRLAKIPDIFQQLFENGEVHWVDDVTFVSDVPGKNDETNGLGGGGKTSEALGQLIKNAQQSIEIQTPYLITTDEIHNLFREAIGRGVKIRILTNSLSSTDNLEAFSTYQSTRDELLQTGVQIFEFRSDGERPKKIMEGELHGKLENHPIFGLHSKSMIIDGNTTIIGTFNLDPRSINLSTECITIIKSVDVAEEVLAGMEEEFAPENAWKVSEDFNPDGEVSAVKRVKTWTRKIIPKDIL